MVATVILVIVAVVIIIACTVFTGGTVWAAIAPVLLGIAKGILIGALVGGLSGGIFGGIVRFFNGEGVWKSFLEGVENGMFAGAVSGAITGGLGVAFELEKLALALASGGADALASILGDVFDNVIKGDDNSVL